MDIIINLNSKQDMLHKELSLTSCIFVSILSLLIATGCGSTKSLSSDAKNELQSIAIDQSDIYFKNEKDYIAIVTRGAGWSGALGGAIGAAIYESTRDKSPEGIVLYHLNNNNMFKNAISKSFEYQFSESKMFTIDNKENADAYLELNPLVFQLVEYNSGKFKLILRIDAKIIAKDGRVMWEDWELFSAFNENLAEYSLEEYLSDPTKLQHGISVVSQMIAREFIQGMGGSPVQVNQTIYKQ